MSDNTSVYKDHVFPYKYKTIPDGIMILQGNKDVFKKFYKSYWRSDRRPINHN